jgi:hypothetical protein
MKTTDSSSLIEYPTLSIGSKSEAYFGIKIKVMFNISAISFVKFA